MEKPSRQSPEAPGAARKVLAAFGPGGPLSRELLGFSPRFGQIRLATAWAEAIEADGILVAEAATGIGKTFAYLIPAALSGRKVVVSTGTKTLQHQIVANDVPVVRRTTGLDLSCVTLKGKSNYLCVKRVRKFLRAAGRDPAESRHADAVRRFAERTATGDVSECRDVPENSPVWLKVTAGEETCAGTSCPDHDRCFVRANRRQAEDADVVVTNHHMLLNVLCGGGADLLHDGAVLVADEAHGLPGTAMAVFGQSLSSLQASAIALGVPWIYTLGERVRRGSAEFLARCERLFSLVPAGPGRHGVDRQPLCRAAADVADAADAFDRALSWSRFAFGNLRTEAETVRKALDKVKAATDAFRQGDDADSAVWGERQGGNVHMHRTPIAVGPHLRAALWERRIPFLLTSATLSVSRDLGYFRREAGLSDDGRVQTMIAANEFDYRTRTVFCVPQGMPDPSDPGFGDAVCRKALEAITHSGGGALVLCTTHLMMKRVADFLRKSLPYKVFRQGEGSRAAVLADFRADRDSVLVATGSFWEGVDVPGESLRCLVIDKLPFAPPDDPLTGARIRAVKARGGNPFSEHQLPEAILALRQGVGRLLRRHEDYGAIVLLDHRIATKPYGAAVRENMPDSRWTRDMDDVRDLFRSFLSARPKAAKRPAPAMAGATAD